MAYTDMTDTFTYNRRCLWTDFNALAVNADDMHDAFVRPLFSAYRSANQTVLTGTSTSLAPQTEDYDTQSVYNATFGIFNTGVGSPTATYLIQAMITWNSGGASGLAKLRLLKDMVSIREVEAPYRGGVHQMFLATFIQTPGNAEYTLQVHQASGGSLTLLGGTGNDFYQGFEVTTL